MFKRTTPVRASGSGLRRGKTLTPTGDLAVYLSLLAVLLLLVLGAR